MHRYALPLLLVLAVTQATKFMKCDNGNAALDVDIPGCDSLPCEVHRGHEMEAFMHFETDVTVYKLKPVVRAKALGMWVEFPLGYDDACEYLSSGECPLSPGDDAVYHMKVPILSSYPKISILVEVSLYNEDKEKISCFQVTGKVMD